MSAVSMTNLSRLDSPTTLRSRYPYRVGAFGPRGGDLGPTPTR